MDTFHEIEDILIIFSHFVPSISIFAYFRAIWRLIMDTNSISKHTCFGQN